MLSVKQVAERLNLSRQCVYALIDSGEIPAHRFGVGRGTIRVSAEDLNTYVDSARLSKGGERVSAPRLQLKHINLRPSAPDRANG